MGAGSIGGVGDRILARNQSSGSVDRIAAVKVKAPAEKNFKRAKVKPGRAKRSRSRIGWKVARHVAALVLFCYAGYRAVDLVVRAAPLQVGRIVVSRQRAAVQRGGAKPWHTDSTVEAS